MKKVSKKSGFTLIELLVVITIIGILASLAVPAINGALDKAKQTADTANVRQLGIIFFSLANDEGGRFPIGAFGDSATRSEAGNTVTLFGGLLEDGDITDAKILKAGSLVAYSGSLSSASADLESENIGWDYVRDLETTDNSNIPLFVSKGAVENAGDLESNQDLITIDTDGVWKDKGMVVYYVGNSAEFLKARNERVQAPVRDSGVISAADVTLITDEN